MLGALCFLLPPPFVHSGGGASCTKQKFFKERFIMITNAMILTGYTGAKNKTVILGYARDYGAVPTEAFPLKKGIEAGQATLTMLQTINEFIESKVTAGYDQIDILVNGGAAVYGRQAIMQARATGKKAKDVAGFRVWLGDHFFKKDAKGNKTSEHMYSYDEGEATVALFETAKRVAANGIRINLDSVDSLYEFDVTTEEKILPEIVRPYKDPNNAYRYLLQGKNEKGEYYNLPSTTYVSTSAYVMPVDTELWQAGARWKLDRQVKIGKEPYSTADLAEMIFNEPEFMEKLKGSSAALSVLINDLTLYETLLPFIEKAPEQIFSADDYKSLANGLKAALG